MATIEIIMPKMGESVMEGTILSWLKKAGDPIEEDEALLEIATDKVDTEIPSTHSGILTKILAQVDEVVAVGNPIAIIETSDENHDTTDKQDDAILSIHTTEPTTKHHQENIKSHVDSQEIAEKNKNNNFYSPLVRNIAKKENISLVELDNLRGSGKDNRITKKDILEFVKNRKTNANIFQPTHSTYPVKKESNDEIIEMDRMRKIISERMVDSKRISPHVTSFVEADVTNIVLWRKKIKTQFEEREKEALTYTPILVLAIIMAIKDFPLVNVQVKDNSIIKKSDINVGIATALPNGNLIVPVIHNADRINLTGLVKKINDIAYRSRNNQLNPDELVGGTYTISNVGTFGNTMGTPIIMQPQAAIMALGAITKKPAVIETPEGDAIGIRHKMFLSHSYDHRIIDGALGGMFAKRVAEYLEKFDPNTII